MTGVKTVVPLVLHNQLTIPIHGLKPVAKITIVPLALKDQNIDFNPDYLFDPLI